MTNYNKMSKKHRNETEETIQQPIEAVESVEPVEEIVEIVEEPVVETPEPTTIEGVVSGCAQMYVRSEAFVESEPVGIIKSGTKVQIFETESTDDFYSVCTETGLAGFCMKKFISVL